MSKCYVLIKYLCIQGVLMYKGNDMPREKEVK